MVAVHGVGPPPFIANTDDDENIVEVLSKQADSTIAAVCYNTKKYREDQM